MKERRLKPYHGILFFIITMVILLTIGRFFSYRLGLYGAAITELLFLTTSIAYVLLLNANLKEVFPIKMIKVAPFFGTILMWISAWLLSMVLTSFILFLFPQEMAEATGGTTEALMSAPFLITMIVGAILPAICEEAVHRGVMFHSFLPINKKWLIIVLCAVLFGINHTDLIRFFPTAILGGVIAYIMYETGNMLYGIFFHFIHNAFSEGIAYYAQSIGNDTAQAQDLLAQQPMAILLTVGLYMMMSCIAPFLLYTGAYLVRRCNGEVVTYFPQKRKGLVIGILVGATVVLFVGGLMVFALGVISVGFF